MADTAAINRSILSNNLLLGQLAPKEMDELLACSSVQRFKASEVIFNKGDPGDSFYAILKGRVAIHTISEDGREILLNILEAGSVFGEIAVLDGKERTAGAVTMHPTDLLTVGRRDFIAFLERHPRICIRLMEVLCERLRWTSDIIEDTVFLDIPHRLAKRLLTLSESYGIPEEGGMRLNIKLSQESLGQMLGVTRESINKGLRSLQADGAIAYDHGYIVILDIDQLREIAAPEALH